MIFNVEIVGKETMLTVTRGDKQLAFKISAYKKYTGKNVLNMRPVNALFSTFDQEELDYLFGQYAKVYRYFYPAVGNVIQNAQLKTILLNLFNALDYSRILTWVLDNPLPVPHTVRDHFSTEAHNTPDQTYIRSEYMELAALALLMTGFLPFFGENLGLSRKESGSDMKEYKTLAFLNDADLDSIPPVARLGRYIEKTLQKSDTNTVSVLGLRPTTGDSDHAKSVVMVRILPVADLDITIPNASIMVSMHYYLSLRISSTDTANSAFHEKSTGAAGEDSRQSVMDLQSGKTDLSVGDQAIARFLTEDPYYIRDVMVPWLSNAQLDPFIEAARGLSGEFIQSAQRYLVKWVMAEFLTPGHIDLIEKQHMINLISVAGALLYAKNNAYLSALVMSHGTGTVTSLMSAKNRMSKASIDALAVEFPHYSTAGGAKSGITQTLYPVADIELLITEMESISGYKSLAPSFVTSSFGHQDGAQLQQSVEIRNILATLCCDIASGNLYKEINE